MPGRGIGLPAGARRGEAGAPGAAEPGDRGRPARTWNRAIAWRSMPTPLRVSDFVWRLEAGKLLAAIEEGRPVEEIRAVPGGAKRHGHSRTRSRACSTMSPNEARRVHDRGLARLIECADAALAALIANDTRTRKHCMRAGERHLVVSGSSEAAFRRALRDAGYLLSAESKRPAKSRDSTPAGGGVGRCQRAGERPHRAERLQRPAGRARAAGRGGTGDALAPCRTGQEPGAHPHLPFDAALDLERVRGGSHRWTDGGGARTSIAR